jgi:hypothetical protein
MRDSLCLNKTLSVRFPQKSLQPPLMLSLLAGPRGAQP